MTETSDAIVRLERAARRVAGRKGVNVRVARADLDLVLAAIASASLALKPFNFPSIARSDILTGIEPVFLCAPHGGSWGIVQVLDFRAVEAVIGRIEGRKQA